MQAVELLEALTQRGVHLQIEGVHLRYRGPAGALTPELRAALAARKDEVIALLQERGDHREGDFPLRPAPKLRHEPFDMTDLQAAYWIGEQDFYTQHTRAISYQAYDLPELDLPRFTRALDATMAAHDATRLRFLGDGRQLIAAELPPCRIGRADLRALSDAEARAAIAHVRGTMKTALAALDEGPPIAVFVHELRDRVRLHIAFRLIAFDGTSVAAFHRDLARVYREPDHRLQPCELSFRDYVVALTEHRRSAAYQRSRAYWDARLDALPGSPALPRAPGARPQTDLVFERLQTTLEASSWARLRQRASGHGLPINSVLCAVAAETLRLWSDRDRFTLNVLAQHRPPVHPDIHRITGNCSTTSLLQCEPVVGSFVERVRALQKQLYADLQHSAVSGVALIRELQKRRGGDTREPLMPVVFTSSLDVGRGSDGLLLPLPGARMVDSFLETPQVWLDMQVDEAGDQLVITWDHAAGVYPDGMLAAMFEHQREHLHHLADHAEAWAETRPRPIPAAQLEERRRANATAATLPRGLLHQFFADRVAEDGARLALVDASTSLTYAELDRRSRAVAAALGQRDVRRGDLVGVVADKGWPQIAGVLGVLRAGGAYLPIDSKLPIERLRQIVRHSQARVLVVDARAAARLEGQVPCPVMLLTEAMVTGAPAALEARGDRDTQVVSDDNEIAYVIYTSGPTGQPKGVIIDHRGAVNTIQDVIQRFGLDARDRVLAVSALGFDLSVHDIFGALAVGAALVMPPEAETPDPHAWAELVSRHRVTVWNSVPALLEMTIEYLGEAAAATLASLRLILLSGDWVPLPLVARLRQVCPDARVIALGGATEASIWSNYFPVAELESGWTSVPYGFPLANQSLHVLDANLAPVPSWKTGDLYLGGIGVARGYLHDPERTAASFLRHPETGEPLYRTGDLARYRPGGIVEFLGRRDFQVKIRGFRIELGEIEAHLQQHPGVDTAVAVRAGGAGHGYLVAFVSARREHASDEAALRAFLADRLPAYMVPVSIVTIEAFPLSANGKIDRGALLARLGGAPSGGVPGVRPRDPLEDELLRLWSSLLGAEVPSVTANFFEVGGNSLLAVRLMSCIEEAFGCRLPLSSLFAINTVESQAQMIAHHRRSADPDAGRDGAEPILVSIPPGDGTVALFLVHPVGGDVLCYRELAGFLPGIAVYGLRSPLLARGRRPDRALAIEDLAARYLEALSRAQPTGPVHLGGWSMGGAIALEMARQLIAAGRQLGSLSLIDAWVGSRVGPEPFTPSDSLAELVSDLARGAALRALLAPVKDQPAPQQLARARDLLVERGVLDRRVELAELDRLWEVHLLHSRALRAYTPAWLPVKVSLFQARHAPRDGYTGLVPIDDPEQGWLDRFAEHEIEVVDADHHSIITGEIARSIAAKLARAIRPPSSIAMAITTE